MTEKFFQELTIWGENGEKDLLLLVKNVMLYCLFCPLWVLLPYISHFLITLNGKECYVVLLILSIMGSSTLYLSFPYYFERITTSSSKTSKLKRESSLMDCMIHAK
jgi:uncharacterized membrane-anchored protein